MCHNVCIATRHARSRVYLHWARRPLCIHRHSKTSLHVNAFRQIVASHKIKIYGEVEVLHRFNAGTPIGKGTLTLVVQSEIGRAEKEKEKETEKWTPAIHTLRTYIAEQAFVLKIEFIDHRIFTGMFTLPILATDPLTALIAKRKHAIVKLLNGCGEEWTSLEFWYRGHGKTRGECKAMVLIGVPEPEKKVWWEDDGGVVERVKEKVQGKMEVEVCWREVVKC